MPAAAASVDRLEQVPKRLAFLFDYAAERALDTIRASKPTIVGAVLNRIDFEGNRYYYSRYYGYQYKSYYQSASA